MNRGAGPSTALSRNERSSASVLLVLLRISVVLPLSDAPPTEAIDGEFANGAVCAPCYALRNLPVPLPLPFPSRRSSLKVTPAVAPPLTPPCSTPPTLPHPLRSQAALGRSRPGLVGRLVGDRTATRYPQRSGSSLSDPHPTRPLINFCDYTPRARVIQALRRAHDQVSFAKYPGVNIRSQAATLNNELRNATILSTIKRKGAYRMPTDGALKGH